MNARLQGHLEILEQILQPVCEYAERGVEELRKRDIYIYEFRHEFAVELVVLVRTISMLAEKEIIDPIPLIDIIKDIPSSSLCVLVCILDSSPLSMKQARDVSKEFLEKFTKRVVTIFAKVYRDSIVNPDDFDALIERVKGADTSDGVGYELTDDDHDLIFYSALSMYLIPFIADTTDTVTCFKLPENYVEHVLSDTVGALSKDTDYPYCTMDPVKRIKLILRRFSEEFFPTLDVSEIEF